MAERGGGLVATLLHDVRYACRTLRRSRTFTITALTVLALGIGANTIIYTVVRGLAFRPLPFDNPERLVFVGELGPGGRREPVSPANFLDLARETRAFEHLAIHRGGRFILTGGAFPEFVIGANVSDTFFSVLRVRPSIGRAFLREDVRPGAAPAAMLSDAGWRRLFSRDPAILGRTIALDGIDHTVVGVLPPGFSLWDTDVWVAGFDPSLWSNRAARNMGAIGRLAKGVSLEGARAELDTIGRRLAIAHPATNAGWSFRAMTLQEAWLGGYRSTSLMLLGAAAMVLLIACGNLANLLLERALSRDREIALRLALGARRGRLVRQMFTESLVLALLGGGAGVVAAVWSLGYVRTLIPANTLTQTPGGAGAIQLDLHTLGVVLILTIVTAGLFGLAPAVRIAHSGVQGALRESARGSSRGRQSHVWRRTLVVAQVALCAILLIGATLMIQSFRQLQGLDRGYDADNALSVSLRLPQSRYPEPVAQQAFFTAVIERMRGLPGVARAGGVTLLSARGRAFAVDGQVSSSPEGASTAVYRVATADYLAAIGIPLVAGRHFSEADRPGAPAVAIVNQALARMSWPNADPIGRRLRLLGPPADVSLTVIGVAGDVKESLDPRYPLQLDSRPMIYRPSAQEPVNAMTLVLRTEIDPLAIAGAVRREVAAVDSTIPILAVQTVRQGLAQSMATPRFNTVLLVGFGALALLLAAVGVYGVIAYSVQQRTHEIGIRMALGAAPSQVLREVVGEGVLMAVAGVGLGLAGAVGAVRLIAHYLFGVRTTDPAAFMLVSCVLLIVAAAASYVPARRAARVDPLVALRHE
jgi:putative ABC transport system permease protein